LATSGISVDKSVTRYHHNVAQGLVLTFLILFILLFVSLLRYVNLIL